MSFTSYPAQANYKGALGEFELFLDIDIKSKVHNIKVVGSGSSKWMSYFDSLEELTAQSFESILNFPYPNDEVFPLGPWLLEKAYRRWKGEQENFLYQQVGPDQESLICRCFGVYKNQIQEIIDQNPKALLRDVTGELKAGAGCATCIDDIRSCLSSSRIKKGALGPYQKNQKRRRIAGLSSVEFILEVDSLLKSHDDFKDVEIINFNGEAIEVAGETRDSRDMAIIEKLIFERFKEEVFVISSLV